MPADALPAPDAPITLYGRPTSGNAYKVALLLEMAERPWTYRFVPRIGGADEPAFKAVSRLGQVPTLVHGELAIGQSNAILWYLAELTGKFAPEGPLERLRVSEWLFWEQDMMMEGVARTRVLLMFLDGDPATVALHRGIGERALNALEAHFADADFLVGGRPTIADLSVYGYASMVEEAGFDPAPWPRLRAWRDRIEALPGWAPIAELMPEG